MLDEQVEDARAWLAADIDSAECVVMLTTSPGERGQLQFLNNRKIVHYRSRFVDDEDPARKRHLVRTWYRESGLPTYDG